MHERDGAAEREEAVEEVDDQRAEEVRLRIEKSLAPKKSFIRKVFQRLPRPKGGEAEREDGGSIGSRER